MTHAQSAGAETETPSASPLVEIESLTARVRAGDLSEDDALSRIARLVRGRDRFETYQKPLG